MRSLKIRILSCTIASLLCLCSLAFAAQTVTCEGGSVKVALTGTNYFNGKHFTTYTGGTLERISGKGHQFTGGTGANYYGNSAWMTSQNILVSARGMGNSLNITDGANGTRQNAHMSNVKDGVQLNWHRGGYNNSIHKDISFLVTGKFLTSVTMTCYARIYYMPNTTAVYHEVKAGDWEF